MKIDEGGAAFPWKYEYQGEMSYIPGMSLRDYFAGQALIGLLTNTDYEKMFPSEWAGDAYKYADAMIAERNKK